MKNILLPLAVLVFVTGYGQTTSDADVSRHTNKVKLQELAQQHYQNYLQEQLDVQSYLLDHPHLERRFLKDDKTFEIVRIENGQPVYYETHNLGSAQTMRANHLYNGGSLGLSVHGQGQRFGVWDDGQIRPGHQELDGRVYNTDGANIMNHATHVGGTIFASGVTPAARGIAFESFGVSYDWNNDLAEMAQEAASNLLVSNHSYGEVMPHGGMWIFGAYTQKAKDIDEISFNAPYYTIVKSAGNDRNSTADPLVTEQNTNKGGHDLLKGFSNAKNSLLVGAVNQVNNYTGPSSVSMSGFSSWGPTDDGRIKPDLVAKGVGVYSPTGASNTSYATYQGTSMSSPAVAGACLLLQQYYFSLNNVRMRSATLQGLLRHTADEAGAADGPDYKFGWGLVNLQKAAQLIGLQQTQDAVISELILQNNGTYTLSLEVSGDDPLMVSIAWTDPAATNINTGTIDPDALYLVNDLDLRVIGEDQTHFPWTLDPSNPEAAAVRSQDNFRDNYEKVQVDNPNGVYTIQVTHKGSLVGGQQHFSLIVNGSEIALSTADFNQAVFSLYPNPTQSLLHIALPETPENAIAVVIDVQGRVVQQLPIIGMHTDLDVSAYQNGVYFVKLIQGDVTTTQKFIKN